LKKIDAKAIQKAFLSAAVALDEKKDWINELNVFPVPDGDTGTNMTMTMMAAAKEVSALEDPDMETLCKTISSGSLRGARGNSGVITSQLLRGLTKVLIANKEVDVSVLTAAFTKAVDTAYKAVMKPKEGTILTVAKGMGDTAAKMVTETDDLEVVLDAIVKAGNETLAKTPDMLPVLKQAGVVDSGGQGLMVMVEAMVESLKGHHKEYAEMTPSSSSVSVAAGKDIETNDIKFGYCTEFIINSGIDKETELHLKGFLESIGDSIVCVSDDDFVKIHVHTNDPGKVLSKALQYGELSRIKIDNMREEHNELLAKENSEPKKRNAVIAVSVGFGLSQLFLELGADKLIEGGQTMNPSTEDIVNAIKEVNAKCVYVLPNNKNIILAAQQAAQIVEDVDVKVIPTKSIPMGIAALMNYDVEGDEEQNTNAMTNSLEHIDYCEITHAVRDTEIDNFIIKCGDYIAIGQSGMLAVEKTKDLVAKKAIAGLVKDDTELVTIYYGEDSSEDEANEIAEAMAVEFPNIEFDVEYGGQPVYCYYISAE